MEAELLRPASVPISPETILWFEFLLDPGLLLRHLQKTAAEPPPSELITKFYDVISETFRNNPEAENGEIINVETNIGKNKPPAKTTALKILSLKVGAFLKWNLVEIRNLPFKTQISLLQDLMYFTNDKKTVEIPNVEEEDVKTASPPYLFALLLFHRWLLSTSMHRITSNWQTRYGLNDISMADESIICCPENINKTVNFLTEALEWQVIPALLTFDCFKLPTESNDSIEFDWSKSEGLNKNEFCAQINYDLGVFFFYREQYDLAKKHFSNCYKLFADIPEIKGFYDVDKKMLEVYINACHGSASGSLLEQFHSSIVNQYKGILTILQEDNVKQEIPLVHRINLELDLQGALSSGGFTVARDLIQKIKAFNIIRCILDRKPLYHHTLSSFKNTDSLLWVIQTSWNDFSFNQKQIIKTFMIESILKNDIPDLISKIQAHPELNILLDKLDIAYIQGTEPQYDIPESLIKTDLKESNKKRKPKTEHRYLEKQLMSCNDYKIIRELLVKMAMMNSGAIWSINPHWELPIPLQSVVKSLPRGFIQDFSYVMLAKSKELLLNKNYKLSLEFLLVLEKELQAANTNLSKLSKLVTWEILLVQITQYLDQGPTTPVDKNTLADACEACLQVNDLVIPRSEVVEQCSICLLRLGRWDSLINLDKRFFTFEITSAIALNCQELSKHKGGKKLSKNLWDLTLPVFSLSVNQSRKNSNGFNDASNIKNNLVYVFFKLKDTWCLSVVISMLTKMFNILKDENSLEVQTEYCNLWPAAVSNANSYNAEAVHELLAEIVTHALKQFPNNPAWLRLMGDINFAYGHYQVSLSNYLKSLLVSYDYFNIPVRNDDHMFRRMIKCCTTLGCYTQAAVLCQFLEETDYMLAFRTLSEQKTCNDAVDAYYHCFWDISILEYLIYIHNKKGEFQRRKCATQVIGMLELNSSNNEEIQREASNLRKSTFLRALCKQFVF